MTTKKPAEAPATNSNVNTNTNTVNVKVEYPKPRRTTTPKSKKPNWVLKTTIVGIIGLVLSLIGFYIKKQIDEKEPAPSIHYPAVSGQRTDQ